MFKNINFRIGLFFLAFALFVIVFMIPTISEEWRQASTADVEFFTIGPRFFPYLATGIIGLLSVILIGQSWLQHRARSTTRPGSVFTGGALKAVLISMGIGTSYIVLIPLLGVIVVTPLCLAAYFWYFGLRRWVWIIVVPIVLTVFIYISFGKFMMVPLPMGLLER